MKKPIEVACPQCGNKVLWSTDNRYRPFCSERCKLMDLGQWATGGYSIPVAEDAIAEDFVAENLPHSNL